MKLDRKHAFVLLGPFLYLVLNLIGRPEDLSHEAFQVLSITLWMAAWWVTEAVPIAVTALLPIVLFPLTGALELSKTTEAFGHRYIFLYIGGFMLAIAIESWDLHKRIALNIIRIIGTNKSNIILGFMLATAFLSMWISNTATAVMILPIGMAITSQLKANSGSELKQDTKKFGKALMLGIAYSASIGGMATLIGTPPNLVFAGIVEETYGIEITFVQWVKFGLPISIVLLFSCWKYLTKISFTFEQQEFPGGKKEIERLLKKLGAMKLEEKTVATVFVITALCWMGRSFILEKYIPNIDDTIIAMTAGIILFILPSQKKGKRIINWKKAVKMPWGIILLFGGGMALAEGFKASGLAVWIGSQMTLLDGLSLFLLVLLLVAAVNFLTEITSNLATTAMLLPILAPMALAISVHPYVLMVAATVAASCAFMLPVATPPNAVVFGSGYLKIPDMVKTGIWMNIFSIILLSLVVYFILPLLWEFDPNVIASEFRP